MSYPFHDKTVTITNCGRICIAGQKIHLSTVFAGHDVGVRQVEDDVWLVSFMDYDLGYFDLESNKVQALDNPFGPKVLGVWAVKSVNHVLGILCKPCDRFTPLCDGGSGETRTRDQRIKSPLLYRLSYRPSIDWLAFDGICKRFAKKDYFCNSFFTQNDHYSKMLKGRQGL